MGTLRRSTVAISILLMAFTGCGGTGDIEPDIRSADGPSPEMARMLKNIPDDQMVFNSTFDEGTAGWNQVAWLGTSIFSWVPLMSYNGTACISIHSPSTAPNDARWEQAVNNLVPGLWYNVSGWVKGENITGADLGANLCLMNSWEGSGGENSTGTFDWKKIFFTFQAGNPSETIACRLGHFGNTVSGTAWFDDIHCTAGDFRYLNASHNLQFVLESADTVVCSRPALKKWLRNMNSTYRALADLTGSVPYGGDRIKIVSIRQPVGGWAVAGNPIRWRQQYVAGALRRVDEQGDWVWGILHELGHDFDHEKGWVFDGEFSASLKAYYVVQELGATIVLESGVYRGSQLQEAVREMYDSWKAAGMPDGNWSGIYYRFLLIADRIGWDAFKETYRTYVENPSSGLEKFNLFMDKLSEASGTDVRTLIPDDEMDWIVRNTTT